MKLPMVFPTALVSVMLLGCVTSTGAKISTEQVKSIIPGKSTKSNLLNMFGAPVTIASRGETLNIPSPCEAGFPLKLCRGSYRLKAETFFTLFPEMAEDNIIYYYYHAVSYKYPIMLILYNRESGKTKTDRLWVLVNEMTGIVEDYAFKRYDEITVFGRSP